MSEKPDKNAVYISKAPLYAYENYAMTLLQRVGTAKIMARGDNVKRAILVVHLLIHKFAGVHIMDEHTGVVELEDDRPPREDDTRPPTTGPRTRLVSVYEATLAYEQPSGAKSEQ